MLERKNKTPLIIPPRLQKGDTIGFISPSAGLAPFVMHRIEQAVKIFEGLGYKVKIAPNTLKNSGYVSASVEERLEDLHYLFRDPEVGMIMATIGGNHSNQLLKRLDYKLIKENPKIFIGYSDITVLHFAIYTQSGLATYYGPCAMTQFGEYPRILEYTLKFFKKEVFAEERVYPYNIPSSETWTDELLDWFKKEDLARPRLQHPNKGYEWLQEGKAVGELIGGAIPSMNHLAGTEYWIDPENKIYFLDIPESHDIYHGLSISEVDSYLADLDNLGVFEKITGLIIGRPYRYSEDEHKKLQSLMLKYMRKNKCPILYNANIGHSDPITTLRYGAVAELDSSLSSFKILA